MLNESSLQQKWTDIFPRSTSVLLRITFATGFEPQAASDAHLKERQRRAQYYRLGDFASTVDTVRVFLLLVIAIAPRTKAHAKA